MSGIDETQQKVNMPLVPPSGDGGFSSATTLPKQKIKMPSVSLFGEGGRRYRVSSEKDYDLAVYNEERLGFGRLSAPDRTHWSEEGFSVFGTKISRNDDTGLCFDASLGLKGNYEDTSTPTTWSGGSSLNIELGYKLPLNQDESHRLTWDSYMTLESSYRTAGKNYITDQLKNREGNHSQVEDFIRGGLTSQLSKEHGYSCGLDNYDINYGNIKIDRLSFDGNRVIESYSGEDIRNVPKIDIWDLKAGAGTGFTLNNELSSGHGKISIYAGVEAGYHNVGPHYKITAENITKANSKNDASNVTDLGDVSYTSANYKHPWYVTPKLSLTYKQNGGFLETSLTGDAHQISFSVRMNMLHRHIK